MKVKEKKKLPSFRDPLGGNGKRARHGRGGAGKSRPPGTRREKEKKEKKPVLQLRGM